EMNLLLASLRRVEIRVEPQTITEFLKWKNRMQDYNGGNLPEGITPAEREPNLFLQSSPTENWESRTGAASLTCVLFLRLQKKTGLVGPVSVRRVEMRLHQNA